MSGSNNAAAVATVLAAYENSNNNASSAALTDNPVPFENQPAIMEPMTMEFSEDIDDKKTCVGHFCCRRRGKNFWAVCVGFFILAASVGGLVAVLYDHPALVENPGSPSKMGALPGNIMTAEAQARRRKNDLYYRKLRRAVISQVYNGSYNPYTFLQVNSPQKLAMEWMSYVDVLHIPIDDNTNGTGKITTGASDNNQQKDETYSQENHGGWIQRYALMTLYFANGHSNANNFLSNSVLLNGTSKNFSSSNDDDDNGYNGTTSSNTSIPDNNDKMVFVTWSRQAGIPECQWSPAVTCNEEGFVTKLHLKETLLWGSLPKEIGLLSLMQHLELGGNQLTGRLPSELFGLSLLETLNLNSNRFEGPIDPSISRLQNLNFLNLERNGFSGDLPSTTKSLVHLKHLLVNENPALGGPIFSYSTSWLNLESIDVSRSQASGSIPTEIGLLTALDKIVSFAAPLSGTIPSEIGQTRLREFTLDANIIRGTIPSEIGLLKVLEFVLLRDMLLTGTLPSELGSLSNLNTFAIRALRTISGTIPTEIGLLTKIVFFQISGCDMSGTIPTELGRLPASTMWFTKTELSGTMPQEICDNDQIQDVTADCEPLSAGLPPKVECDPTCCSLCTT